MPCPTLIPSLSLGPSRGALRGETCHRHAPSAEFMWTRGGLYDPRDPQPLAHSIVPDKDALVVLIRNGHRIAVARGGRRGRVPQLGTMIRINQSRFVPCSPAGGPRNRSGELAAQVIVVIAFRITQHGEIPGPVDAGDKDWIDVTVSRLVGERHPGVVMFLCIFFEGARPLYVFSIRRILSQKGGALFCREPERSAGGRSHRSGVRV